VVACDKEMTSPFKLKKGRKARETSKVEEAEEAVKHARDYQEALRASVKAISVRDDALVGAARGMECLEIIVIAIHTQR
jgi:hypothetical protein